MKRHHWWFLASGVIAILITVPMIVNGLMFMDGMMVAGDDKTWIGFLGSFVGAIAGGVISGLLTLFGVILTINRQRDIDFENRYPKIALHGKKIKNEIQELIININKLSENKSFHNYVGLKVEDIRQNSEQLLEWSAEISGEAFNNVDAFLQILSQFETEVISKGITFYSDDPNDIENLTIKDEIVQKYIESIRTVLKTHTMILNQLAEQYYKNRK
jgi:hypothetical protein